MIEEVWSQSESNRGRRSEKSLATSFGVRRSDGKQDDAADAGDVLFFFFFLGPSSRIADSSERQTRTVFFLVWDEDEEGDRGRGRA